MHEQKKAFKSTIFIDGKHLLTSAYHADVDKIQSKTKQDTYRWIRLFDCVTNINDGICILNDALNHICHAPEIVNDGICDGTVDELDASEITELILVDAHEDIDAKLNLTSKFYWITGTINSIWVIENKIASTKTFQTHYPEWWGYSK